MISRSIAEHEKDSTSRQTIDVLVVEDSPEDARAVRRFLGEQRRRTFRLTVRTRLADALETLEESSFDAALVDLRLPDSGSRALGTLEALQAAHPDLPLIVLTGLDDDEMAEEAMRAGAQDYLVKDDLTSDLLARSLRYAIERAKARRALEESERRYALAVEGSHDGLWDWDLTSGSIYLSPRWKSMLGYEADEIGESPDDWLALVHPEDLGKLESGIASHTQGETPHLEIEHRVRHRDGSYRWVLSRGVAVLDEEGRAVRMAGSMTDITRRKAAEERLLHDALHDSLTGLPNRTLFLDRLGVTLAQTRRAVQDGSPRAFCVLFLDMDRFKNVNDSLGHTEGDHLLLAMARRLSSLVRPGDTVARLGGDEFTMLMPFHGRGVAEALARRILVALEVPFDINGREVYVTGSIGIAIGPGNYETPEEILRDADTAMYRAKAHGRARFVVFDSEMHRDALTTLQLETDLRRAVERGELHLHYQPIVKLETGQLAGFEALLRWEHAEMGSISPGEIIPLAEETDLISRISEWAIGESCRQLARWREAFPEAELTMSINLSNKQFQQSGVVEMISKSLSDAGIEPGRLRIELTESAIMENAPSARLRLERLQELGIGVDIDDFGTGYSSLSHLHQLPIDTLKIDRSFISGMGEEGKESQEIVALIVNLARQLGLRVAAEGVETESQLEQVRNLRCDLGQGFLLARPMDDGAASELIRCGSTWQRN